MQKLKDSELRYRRLFEAAQDGILILDAKTGMIDDVNPFLIKMLGYSRDEFEKKKLWEVGAFRDVEASKEAFEALQEKEYIRYEDMPLKAKDGRLVQVEFVSNAYLVDDEKVIQCNIRDITERKRAERKIRRQIDYMTALQDIERTIASTFDMHQSLNALVSKAVSLLAVDAAAVSLTNLGLNSLEFIAGEGFRTNAARTSLVKLSESYAGKAAMEHRMVKIPNPNNEADNLFLTDFLKGEDFVSYYGMPLIVKGKAIGVLEVFQRSLIKHDQEWLDFLNSLAGQAAVAISNAQLFDNLQQSNRELLQSYDATIEGWSRALDLRDKETEGHTQRVAKTTVEFARALGLNEQELVQVRWGALLHDIGKMGVPDGILLKHGALTLEEWVTMRMHPIFACEMLAPIHYLRLALDIPCHHHEKWDGTGYPHGLKGEEIPLTARIFAVIDVWDALSSDRPYRLAWEKDNVREQIRAESGTHFDPQIVDMFMRMSA